ALEQRLLFEVRQNRNDPGSPATPEFPDARHKLFVAAFIAVDPEGDLLEVVGALSPRRRLAHLLHGRHEQGDQNRDNRDDHQEFNQREPSTFEPHGKLLRMKKRKTYGDHGEKTMES